MRLIDADKLIEVFEEQDHYLWKLPNKENPHKRAKQGQLNWCINAVRDQPTVPGDQEHEVCENCPYKLEDIGDFSDGYHTFNDLYTQRAVLFATIVNQNPDKAWKSRRHEDGKQCFGGGWFIVGVDTPKGSYTYHYEEKYWSIFKCVELPVAKHWDGHTDKDVWRLLLLT